MSAPSSVDAAGEGAKAPKAVVRQSGITSVVATVGVLSGLVLDLVWTSITGFGARSDAFALALRLPLAITAIAMVVANQVLVPTFGAWLTRMEGRERGRAMAAVMVASAAASLALALVFAFFAYPLMGMMAPGLDESTIQLAADFTKVLAWFIPCVILAEVLRSWLNANLVIGFPAAMTLVLNAVAVGFLLLGTAVADSERLMLIPWAYVAGSLVQLLAMAVAAVVKGWRPARPDFRHPEVRHTLRLFSRPTLAASLNPLVRIVEVFVGSELSKGTVTALHYGNRLASAVGGTIIFRSIMVTVLPRISRAWARQDIPAFRSMTRLGLRLMFLLAVPMTILGVVLAPPLCDLVFGRMPKFDAHTVTLMGVLMALYSLSFAGSGIQRALLAPFYAMRDTRTPLLNTIYGIVANIALIFILDLAIGHTDRAVWLFPIAYSASQYVNVAHGWWRMRSVEGLQRLPLTLPLAGSLVSGLAGGSVAWLILRFAPGDLSAVVTILATTAGLGVSAAVGLLAFKAGSRGRGGIPNQQPDTVTALAAADHTPDTLASGEQEDLHVSTTTQRPAPPAPSARGDQRSLGNLNNIVTALLGVALTVWTVVGLFNATPRMAVALPLAVIVGVALLLVAFNDLETFILVALAMRASLDALRTPGPAPDPHLALGLMMLGLGTLWLVVRRIRLGRSFPVSALGLAYLAFLTIALIGVITAPRWSTAITEWSRIANIVVIFLVVEQFAARGSRLKPFIAAIGLAILVPAAAALVQLSSGEGLFVAGGFSRITGTFDHSNPLAYFSVIVLLLMVAVYPAVRDLTRVAVATVGLIALICLGLTYTRSAWLVALLGVIILLARRRAFASLAVIAALAVMGLATPQVQARFADLETSAQISGKPANSLAWRWAYWGESLEVAKPSPIAGVGLRTVATTTAEGKQPHNDVIRSYVELGIPGLLSYLFVLLLMVWTTGRAAADAARRRIGGVERAVTEAGFVVAISLAVLSIVANLMSQAVVTIYAVSVIALASGLYLRRKRLDAEADAAADVLARSASIPRT
jgi:murein biosynthesis integral membrane protein MurJ